MNKTEYTKIKELVFDLVCGESTLECLGIKNEFTDGRECDKLYQELYKCIEQIICEQPKLEPYTEKIQNNHTAILRLIALKMFDHGWVLAQQYKG